METKKTKIQGIEFELLKIHNVWVVPVIEYYSEGLGSPIAMSLLSFDGEALEPYNTITVNLPDCKRSAGCQFIDTNNNGDDIISWLEENDLGKRTGNMSKSGYCEYPEFNFYSGKKFMEYKALWDKLTFSD